MSNLLSSCLTKLCTGGNLDYFRPTMDLLESCNGWNIQDVADLMLDELEQEQVANVLSLLLTIENGDEDDIEGVEFTDDEINAGCTLFACLAEDEDVFRAAQGL